MNLLKIQGLGKLFSGLCLLGTAVLGLGMTKAEAVSTDSLQVYILKVGKADAIVLLQGEKCMVIDAGEEDDGKEVVEFLQKNQVSRVDTLIITHFDQDHVGGADSLIHAMEVGEVLLPDYEGVSLEYVDLLSAMKEKGMEAVWVRENLSFSFGDARVMVEPPLSYEILDPSIEYDNDFSLITTVVHGSNRLLFTGDIEKQRIRQWLETEGDKTCDFLKFPHHGVYNSALDELLDATCPRHTVICDSAKNPAEAKTLDLIASRGIDVKETKDSRITVISDGSGLTVEQKLK